MRPGYWLLLIAGTICACYLWGTGPISRWCSSMRAKIHFDLSIPSSPIPTATRRPFPDRKPRFVGESTPHIRRHRSILSSYMLRLYERRPHAVVRAIRPAHICGPLYNGGRIFEFTIPSIGADERPVAAELLGNVGTIFRVQPIVPEKPFPSRNGSAYILKSRKDDAWHLFDVTSAIAGKKSGDTVKLYVHGRVTFRSKADTPILLLNYTKTDRERTVAERRRRSAAPDEDPKESRGADVTIERWKKQENALRKRRRNLSCRRRPMYVDFSTIEYDNWVIAPAGYQAYQCSGKCYYPLDEYLNPTKHAIVQTLLYGALQARDLNGGGTKNVGRACCVPIELAPTSLLYMDVDQILTYKYSYEDMVVVECGCR